MLLLIPVLQTKAFASNVKFKLCDLDLKDLKKYKVKEIPSLALYTNMKLEKIVS
jgi:hypothetical protein